MDIYKLHPLFPLNMGIYSRDKLRDRKSHNFKVSSLKNYFISLDTLLIEVKHSDKYWLLPKNDQKIHEVYSVMEWV